MITRNPLLISSKGGTITCLKEDSGLSIYQACSKNNCIYSGNLHTAKLYLENLDGTQYPAKNKLRIFKEIFY
tara:strand:- start:96 stop:311 length:216 start_codon:yes stop_codon:yes gene_type:complete